ncbi:MAG: DUF1906 domain-containing protein [Solirubrobacteraceae bacterium]
MNRTAHRSSRRPGSRLALATLLSLLAAVLVPAAGFGAAATRVVSYHGYRLTVPAGWPVYDLAAEPGTCVRFDRHAVYLGRPGAAQECSARSAAGRTEAILVAPLAARAARAGSAGTEAGSGRALPQPALAGAAPRGGNSAQLVDAADGVVVTATWNGDPEVIAHALDVRSLAAVAKASTARPASALPATARAATASLERPAAVSRLAGGVAQPGAVDTGLGFDVCSTPSIAQMAAWSASPYSAIGVYIGGADMACSQFNLTSAWVSQESSAGWHLIPIYVGLQAPSNSCGCAAISASSAAGEGTAAALDAIAQASAIGVGPGNPLYYDMEGYTPGADSATVLAFLSAWTAQLHAGGYVSGVYSSSDSGIEDLAAQVGTGYLEPDDVWVANWNGAENTLDPNLPSVDWAQHQRLHQFNGGTNATYGGVTLNIDGDYVDAATAASGTGAAGASGATPHAAPVIPTLAVSTDSAGDVDLLPSWTGATPVSFWQVLAGSAPAALTPADGAPVSAGAATPIVVRSTYGYFAVEAIGAGGQPLGTSTAIATPSHVAIFGQSAFVARSGIGGLPVGCYGTVACHLTTTIWAGSRRLLTTGSELVTADSGGLVYFELSPSEQTLLTRAAHRRLAVKIRVRDASGETATRQLNLLSFTTSGAGPQRSLAPTPALKVLGGTDFVSNGWVGGILTGCFSSEPCEATATITAGGRAIATSTPQLLGVDELGYLMFSLTPAGHRLLARVAGNQLPATVTIASVPASATGATATTGAGSAAAGGSAAPGGSASATGSLTTTAQIALVAY